MHGFLCFSRSETRRQRERGESQHDCFKAEWNDAGIGAQSLAFKPDVFSQGVNPRGFDHGQSHKSTPILPSATGADAFARPKTRPERTGIAVPPQQCNPFHVLPLLAKLDFTKLGQLSPMRSGCILADAAAPEGRIQDTSSPAKREMLNPSTITSGRGTMTQGLGVG
jgi:hypothetical protein